MTSNILKHSTPIVVFAHIPLWACIPEWGWGTDDSAQALAYLKKFGSVTVLNEAHSPDDAEGRRPRDVSYGGLDRISQPRPGTADSPGPMKVPADQLKSILGITDVTERPRQARARRRGILRWRKSRRRVTGFSKPYTT